MISQRTIDHELFMVKVLLNIYLKPLFCKVSKNTYKCYKHLYVVKLVLTY